MNTFIAIAILVGSAFLGVVVYMKGVAAPFRTPDSRVTQWVQGSILVAMLVISLSALTFGGWWTDLLPWCALLLCMYYCVRGSLLLLQPPGGSACGSDGTNNAK